MARRFEHDPSDDLEVLWQRPDPALTEFEVTAMFNALWKIQGAVLDILRILKEEFDGEAEADEP